MQFTKDVRAEAIKTAPWNEWRLVLVDVDNKLPMYLQNQGSPFYYVLPDSDIPKNRRQRSAHGVAGEEKWRALESRTHDHCRTVRRHQSVALGYLTADHQLITTRPNNGARLFHAHESGSAAYIPKVKTDG